MSVSFTVSKTGEKENHKEIEIKLNQLQPNPPPQSKKPWLLASIVLILEVAGAVGEAQLTALGFKLSESFNVTVGNETTITPGRSFEAPYFYTLARFIARSTAFPILFVGMWIFSLVSAKSFSPKGFFRHCSTPAGPGPSGITPLGMVRLFALPTIFAITTGVGYIVALVYVAPSITSACFSTGVAMSYILSIFFLKHPHLIIKTVFVLVSFGGVAMVAYETTTDPLASDAWIGILAVMLSTISLSLHQLFYSKSFPNADSFQSAFIVSVIFLCAALIYWPVPLAMKLSGNEVWQWSDIPWGYLIGGLMCSLSVAFLYGYGLALSTPFFMSLGELLNLALAGIVDHFARGVSIGPYQISGFAIIGFSFFVLLLPDRILAVSYIREQFTSFRSGKRVNSVTPHIGTRLHTTESKKNLVGSGESTASLAPAS
ncbi:hypothetical protein BV898_10204 [Hypsibius exemplaris]|uniref:EamA domain-containing protein n=1 Tax=Hypsibius exemplaris TaxID=2072580 RepID=A0A1W0WK80_HYPEX|nr:hypothetical protein BV898_10204 [Hypsibius exemplaris]